MKVLIGNDAPPTKRLTVRWLWEPRDVWVGVFWNRVQLGDYGDEFLVVYVAVLPCLPLSIVWGIYPGRYVVPLPPNGSDDG